MSKVKHRYTREVNKRREKKINDRRARKCVKEGHQGPFEIYNKSCGFYQCTYCEAILPLSSLSESQLENIIQ